MIHKEGSYARTLKYYYKRRNAEQAKRWKEILDIVYTMNAHGKPDEEIIDELVNGKYRILLEDPRAYGNKYLSKTVK